MNERTRITRWAIILCLLACLGLGAAVKLTAQAASQGREAFHQSYDLAPGGIVSVSNVSGYIRVTGWNENRVQVDAVKRSSQRGEDLSLVEIEVYTRPDRVEVRTIYPRGRSTSISVDYDLKVPRAAVINALTSTSGEITVTGAFARVVAQSTSGAVAARDITGDVSLATTSGQITAERIGGALKVSSTSGNLTINDADAQLSVSSTSGDIRVTRVKDGATVNSSSGSIRLERVGGRAIARASSGTVYLSDVVGDANASSTGNSVTVDNVRGRTVASSISGRVIVRNVDEGVRATSYSGSVEITNAKGRIEAETTSGGVTLARVESRELSAKSLSGGVHFQGKLYDEGRYEFRSFSSDVVLALPADSSFTLTAQTGSGEVETDFPLRLDPTSRIGGGRRRLQGTAGQGGAQITATTFSGSIRLKKQ
jgi:DUF4097 and DUF4098 domain-containing protein YvlB